jgi:hypothetical protein
LFVDDGSLVLAVIVWLAVSAVCVHAQWLDPASASVLLAVGIAILLVENVLRFARAHQPVAASERSDHA